MSGWKLISLIGVAALAGLATTAAHADPVKSKSIDFTVHTDTPAIAPQGTKSLQWDARRGRWGLTFNMDQPNSREMQLNDVQAGAYFRITPSLRVGGAVALGERERPSGYKKTQPEDGQPRVRLETALKF
ncbi:NtrZ family periplasmic regulatory protein [Phenylobacterium sp.]|uniref:NtrZ family periplasmic regulatory protein n=1 Tax=Phenylobacterium sp. TaxID=1871053 RepID=UPI002F413825